MEEETKETAKKVLKAALKPAKAMLFPIVTIATIVVIIILSAGVYFITIDDGTYKEGDWSSTPYAASTYVNGVTVNDDGTL